MDAKMYQRGRACSMCPPRTSCSPRYRGLCTERLQSSIDDSNEIVVDLFEEESMDEELVIRNRRALCDSSSQRCPEGFDVAGRSRQSSAQLSAGFLAQRFAQLDGEF